ncbi:DUF5937 family protein [Psychromicrobium sp. YIM B11713]|uniref:DUF5937 family protein n=1 Tax=Psychromicrobium sp. YIM B11713 TaxID=3145233 RepID=UPI00374EC008
MSVTIDISGLGKESFRFLPSALAELGSALHLIVEPAHHASQQDWIRRTLEAIDADLMDRLQTADFLWRTSRADMLLPAHPGASLGEELDALDRLSDETWVNAALITSSCGVVPLHPELKSPLVDPAARKLARDRAGVRGQRQLDFVDFVLSEPAKVRAWVRTLLEDCENAFFAVAWEQIVGSLKRDARQKHDLLLSSGISSALEAVSEAVTLDRSGHRIVVDKLQDRGTSAAGQGVTFLPSAFGHPHLLVVHAPGWQPVIQYPVTELASPAITGLEALQERIHALDHPVRLRLVRSLLRSPLTTLELAETWQLSAPEVSRHLAVLKEAGIVDSSRQGRFVRYDINLLVTARLGTDLIEALQR